MKAKQEIIEEWINKNGACSIDSKNKDIILYDGGLFAIEEKEVMRHKILGFKNAKTPGFKEAIFSKKKTEKGTEHFITLWFQELDETINYLKRLKKLLNKLGYNTHLQLKNERKKRK